MNGSGSDEQVGAIAVGSMMAAFGLLGLFLAAGARDDEMSVFGLSLTVFAWAFVMGLIKRHYDRRMPASVPIANLARAAAGTGAHV